MRIVSVTDLKARLSHYLQWVKRGGEVQVLERGVPVARLVGVEPLSRGDKRRERLLRGGVVRAGGGDASWILDEELLELGEAPLSCALEEDREERF